MNVFLVMKPNTYKMENVKMLVMTTTGKMEIKIDVILVMKNVQNVQVDLRQNVLNVMIKHTLKMVNVSQNVKAPKNMKMMNKMNVEHATILALHVNVHHMIVVLHVQEVITISPTKIMITEHVSILVHSDIMKKQKETLVIYVILLVPNVVHLPMVIVHIVIQHTCKTDFV